MLQYKLIHPEILAALGAAGHGSLVLVADGNYPLSTATYPGARRVFLNLTPGIINATEVLKILLEAIPVEAATVMRPIDGSEPAIFKDFRALLPSKLNLEAMGRQEFYAATAVPKLALAILTGEQRLYANILLTIGVRS